MDKGGLLDPINVIGDPCINPSYSHHRPACLSEGRHSNDIVHAVQATVHLQRATRIALARVLLLRIGAGADVLLLHQAPAQFPGHVELRTALMEAKQV